jgi:methylated-DNA-protein-cysteine methyltransferase-like protein
MSALADEIVAVIAGLQPGEVVSYGDIAHDAGHPGASRAVGALLASTVVAPDGDELPWWRVVRSDGRIVTTRPSRQAALLRAEGVTVRGERVVDAPLGRFAATPTGRRRRSPERA